MVPKFRAEFKMLDPLIGVSDIAEKAACLIFKYVWVESEWATEDHQGTLISRPALVAALRSLSVRRSKTGLKVKTRNGIHRPCT
jgi:hypothetical protein